ncbi:uncharacterized protein EV422DRAFT_623934 [Fimicolochytrium jonesii]|uniref:uncharacterized protein n=1 Tax=Fimicolochytrium jonesii TaxID=1396493 RepID=UPI0022FDF7B1|nr:uncharacterized protein EV422DRAFT_623934 [Fimicolochytrium jonesii]KAI8815837.1 hypothetical protein EV422DRAFT_623934 [Fimicolochytrium jonesii]
MPVPSAPVTRPEPRLQAMRATYYGAVLINFLTLLLPALYGTLSKLWIAQLAPSQVVTTDIYTYVGVVTEVVNEGLSRVAFNVIGDKEKGMEKRRGLSWTLILAQSVLGTALSVFFVRENSITYVRIAAFSSLFSVLQYATTTATRSLDRLDIPLLISALSTVLNIILDLIFLSTFRVYKGTPTANTQGVLRLFCDGAAAFAGIAYFFYTVFTFSESAIRNALYLWQVAKIVSLGSDYATAWGVFNTIRWGIMMVPASAFEQATLAFVGHRWGEYKAQAKVSSGDSVDEEEGGKDEPRIVAADDIDKTQGSLETESDSGDGDVDKIEDGSDSSSIADSSGPKLIMLKYVTRPAQISFLWTLAIELILALLMSFALIKPFALYLSSSSTVAELTTTLFHQLDWCYVLFTLQVQLVAVLLATRLDIWFMTALTTNILWVLPWCIAFQIGAVPVEKAWSFYALVFGGGLVFDFAVVVLTLGVWWWAVRRDWRVKWLSVLVFDMWYPDRRRFTV